MAARGRHPGPHAPGYCLTGLSVQPLSGVLTFEKTVLERSTLPGSQHEASQTSPLNIRIYLR
jgi:hypothetical protein